MFTSMDFKQHQERLQSEFIKESNTITEIYNSKNNEALDIYNSTIRQNKKQYDTVMFNLELKYTMMLKELEALIDSYNLSLQQITFNSNINIRDRLNDTLSLTDLRIPNISLYTSLKSIDKPVYLYKFNLSEELSRFLIPDIRPAPDGNYILTINSDHISQSSTLTINSQMTTTEYYYCVAEPLDILIIYTHAYSSHTVVYFNKISTMVTNIQYMKEGAHFMFFNNEIVSHIPCYKDNKWRFDYHTFTPDDLVYHENTVIYTTFLDHWNDDIPLFSNSSYDAIFYINEHNLYRVVISNTITEQFIMTIDLPLLYYDIEIVSFKGNILILRTVAQSGQDSEYRKIYVPDSIIYKYLN